MQYVKLKMQNEKDFKDRTKKFALNIMEIY